MKRKMKNYFFNWGSGGYNSVMATDKRNVRREAEKKFSKETVEQLGGVANVQIDKDYKKTWAMDESTASMFY